MDLHLLHLESEAIAVLREVASQFQNAALLFSGGKDSACLVRLSEKAFRPARIPFTLLHVDTGHNFPETLAFRDDLAERVGARLKIARVQDSIDAGKVADPTGPRASRNAIQSVTLLDAVADNKFDCLIGGARRDEEKARAKERIFSVRDEFGQWEPRSQRPELWNLYNGHLRPGEHMRAFPLSNWTELDVWHYIEAEGVPLPSIYFSHSRQVVRRDDGMLLAACDWVKAGPRDKIETLTVRCRTVGDMTCTGLMESTASTLAEIVREVAGSRTTERGSRADDQISEAAMEDRKRKGYF